MNYRPISLIGHVMKIFEKVIKKQLMVYLEINDLITIDQSANIGSNTIHRLHCTVLSMIGSVICQTAI